MIFKKNQEYDGVIEKKDLKRVFYRSIPNENSYNAERMLNVGYCYAMIPALRKIYKDDEREFRESMVRHLEFYNTTPHVVTLPLGISVAMEEKRAAEKENFDTDTITNVKTALMGPLAGIGDSIYWGALKIFATGIGTSLALQGNILGPILFLLIYNVPHFVLRYILTFIGYDFGINFLDKVEKSGLMKIVTFAVSIIGLMVAGAMVGEMIYAEVPVAFGQGDEATTLVELLDSIIPGLIPLGIFGFTYYLLKKRLKPMLVLSILFAVSILGAYFGILTV